MLDIDAGIEISIQAVPTLLAKEETLRATILPALIPTVRARLGSMSRVNLDDLHTPFLGFIPEEAMQLGKAPTVQASLSFPMAHLGSLSNVRQIFKNQGTARGSVLDDALREHVVVISALPKQFSRELFEMSLSRFGAFGLQFATQTEKTPFLLFPASFPQEVMLRSDGRMSQSQVDPDDGPTWGNSRLRERNHHMQRPFAIAVAQVSTAGFVADVPLGRGWNRERDFKSSCYRGKTTGRTFPLDPVGTTIVTDRTQLDVRTRDGLELWSRFPLFQSFGDFLGIVCLLLFLPRQSRFDGFSGLDPRGTHQLSRQVRIGSTQMRVGLFMQFDPIATLVIEASLHDLIEAVCMLAQGTVEYCSLFGCRLDVQDHCSIHVKGVSYLPKCCQAAGLNHLTHSSRKERLSFRPLEGYGFPGDLRDDCSLLLSTKCFPIFRFVDNVLKSYRDSMDRDLEGLR